jgi:hypothetical protein
MLDEDIGAGVSWGVDIIREEVAEGLDRHVPRWSRKKNEIRAGIIWPGESGRVGDFVGAIVAAFFRKAWLEVFFRRSMGSLLSFRGTPMRDDKGLVLVDGVEEVSIPWTLLMSLDAVATLWSFLITLSAG